MKHPESLAPFIVVVGRHAVGKSTICKAFEKTGYDAYGEIGKELRKEVAFEYSDSVPWFDQKVMELEMTRDAKLQGEINSRPIVIETWHVGNIAFAEQRSPEIAQQYREFLKNHLKTIQPLAVLVDVDDKVFEERASDPVLESELVRKEFYSAVKDSIVEVLKDCEIPYVEVSGTENAEDVVRDVQAWWRKNTE